MSQQLNQHQQLIASYTGKMLRDHFGKGPESVFVSIGCNVISIYLRNFITPSERVLLEQNHEMIIHQVREKLMQMIIPEISSYVEALTDIKLQEFYYDWNLQNKTMMLLGICEASVQGGSPVEINYTGKQQLEREIDTLSQQAQRSPDEIVSFEMNPRMLIIIRKGILVHLEKELIRLGQGELLKRAKRNLEKSFLHNNSSLDSILNKSVQDSFVDWNFTLDKSVTLLITGNK
ncbi:Na-translocating system protein MpsC family protein [Paenibacillus pinihumi]|uniref:Na-translocating system protein MpsC family protein n=1 Tax=Paenibacillus pinihumi TaxID=669462 RepID=UPI00048BB593|nr:Na-translocating system protein MpsC family protein [Paenibacillus pinihumi]